MSDDAKRKKERLEEFKNLLKQEFGGYEYMHNKGMDVVFTVRKLNAGVNFYLSHELLIDERILYNRYFQSGIAAVKKHLESGSGLEEISITNKGLQPFQG